MKIMALLRSCIEADGMSPAQASTIVGRLGFLLTAAFGRVGRAATRPFVQRTAVVRVRRLGSEHRGRAVTTAVGPGWLLQLGGAGSGRRRAAHLRVPHRLAVVRPKRLSACPRPGPLMGCRRATCRGDTRRRARRRSPCWMAMNPRPGDPKQLAQSTVTYCGLAPTRPARRGSASGLHTGPT